MKANILTLILKLLCFIAVFHFSIDLISSIRITSVKAGNNQGIMTFREIPLNTEEAVKLSFDENYLIFNFEVPGRTSFDTIYYQLEGLDYSWMEFNQSGTKLHFTNPELFSRLIHE